MRTRPASLIPEEQVASAKPNKAAPKKNAGSDAEPLRWYRVEDGPRQNGAPNNIGPFRRDQGDYFLKLGNEINSAEYNIKQLLNHGCKLTEIECPGWYIEQQELSEQKAEELRAMGVDVGETPDFEPTPLKKKPGKKDETAAPDAA